MNTTRQAARDRTGAGLLWPGLAALVALAMLLALGVWQMQRLRWKEDIVARIEARQHMAPVPLAPPSDWPRLGQGDYEYTRVSVTGVFEHGKEALIFRPAGGSAKQPGFHVVTPLRITGTNAHILVNRGYVPETLKSPDTRKAGQIVGETVVTGLLRAPEAPTSFTPPDEPGRRLWYSRDPVAIARHLNLSPAPSFSIDADSGEIPGGWPKGGATIVSIRNDHLAYAMTWFGLAATLAGVFGVFAWRRARRM